MAARWLAAAEVALTTGSGWEARSGASWWLSGEDFLCSGGRPGGMCWGPPSLS